MNQIRWRVWVIVGVFAFALVGMGPSPAGAFNQPVYNLGLTNAMDGAIPGPGIYTMVYSQFYSADNMAVNDDVEASLKAVLEQTEVTTMNRESTVKWIAANAGRCPAPLIEASICRKGG